MKIALIGPSNLLYMPYVNNYTKILNDIEIEYDIINWDRFNIKNENVAYQYKDNKYGHQRNLLDYYKFSRFVTRILKKGKYKKVIIFGIQLTFLLKNILIKDYSNEYIIDIRDRNKIIKFFNISKIINHSIATVLSSQGYKSWLPDSNKYITNHNTQIDTLDDLKNKNGVVRNNKKISLSFIGAVRDYKVNIKLIDSLKNSSNINLFFHGEGPANEMLLEYIKTHKVENAYVTGRYKGYQEDALYESSDLINVLRYNEGINNRTALPNRLYKSVIYGKLLVALPGTYLSKLISEYELGLVLNALENVEQQIINYISEFDKNKYEKKRRVFMKRIITENKEFRNLIITLKN